MSDFDAKPSSPRRARRAMPALAVFALGVLAAANAAAQSPTAGVKADVPMPETVEAGPPAALQLAPKLFLSGYATLQYLSPKGSEIADDSGTSAATRAGLAQSTRSVRAAAASPQLPPADDRDAQLGQRDRLSLTHLSLVAWWEPAPRWKVLGELDEQNALQYPSHEAPVDGQASTSYLSLERLYADYRHSDTFALRVGKFLTPIGRWNQEHSDPQTWTTLRPLISQSAFPTSATGVMAFGSLPVGPQWLDYQVYASTPGQWRLSPTSDPFDKAFGLRVSTGIFQRLQLGASYSEFRQRGYGDDRFRLLGLDAHWQIAGIEFNGEVIGRRSSDAGDGNERGWFLQARAPLAARWWLVGRLESYKRASDQREYDTGLVGLLFDSGRHWVAKIEWASAETQGDGRPQGLLASLTAAF